MDDDQQKIIILLILGLVILFAFNFSEDGRDKPETKPENRITQGQQTDSRFEIIDEEEDNLELL